MHLTQNTHTYTHTGTCVTRITFRTDPQCVLLFILAFVGSLAVANTPQEAIELGQRAIYHATFRDAASGGTASVYHVTANGWTKVRGDDVLDLHTKYYPKPELHPTNAVEVM